jgi:hypothetical protein
MSDLTRLLNREYLIKIQSDAMGVACGTHRGEDTRTLASSAETSKQRPLGGTTHSVENNTEMGLKEVE